MTPARILSTFVALTLVVAPAVAPALADDPPHENTGVTALATDVAVDPVRRIHQIKAPVLGAPAITKAGGAFPVELELPAGMAVAEAFLQREDDRCDLTVTAAGAAGASRLWGGDEPSLVVQPFTATVDAGCAPATYALHVTLVGTDGGFESTWTDVQANSVGVLATARYDALAAGTAEPRIGVIADPQVSDPRAFQDGTTDSLAKRHPATLARVTSGIVGDGSSGTDGRWNAIHAMWDALRGEGVDFVLIAGDLGFGQAVPGSYAAEYEEIRRMLVASDLPVFASPGNHDLYVSNGQDGFEYWRAYVGPTHYLAEATPGTFILSMNTYDWSEMDRMGASIAVSAWGGQVRDPQLTWMDDALTRLRAVAPDARVLAVSHHSPSWRQDDWAQHDPSGLTAASEGLPVAEQATRGAVSFGTSDQAWSGENRLPLRDLLREHGVEVAFAGHTHVDRVARDDGIGRIVETHQSTNDMPEDYDPHDLHYFTRGDTLIGGHSQDALKHLVKTASGPLYVETTTVMSGTSQYWGYRVVEFAYTGSGHLDLPKFGYAITQAELDTLARNPALFNVDHVELGLFSTPLRLETVQPWKTLETGE